MSKRPSLAETMRQAASTPAPLEPAKPAPVPTRAIVEAKPAKPAEPANRGPGFFAATRAGKKKVTATLAPGDHKRLRQLALEHDFTTEALLAEAISDLFTKYGKPAIGQGAPAS